MEPNVMTTPTPNTQTTLTPNTPTVTSNKWIHTILFLILLLLIVLTSSNLILALVLSAIVNLLSISIFDHVPDAVVRKCEEIIEKIKKRANGAGSPKASPKWKKYLYPSQFVTSILMVVITVIVLTSTVLRPAIETGFGNLNDAVCLNTVLPWPTCASGFGVTALPDGVRIGLIADNTFGPFDQSMLNQGEKQAEGLIFRENRQACTNQHITLVAVTMLSRTVDDPSSSVQTGLWNLQGDYLAQQEYNATHPSVSICLAIANLGTQETAAQTSSLVQSNPDDYSLPQVIHQVAQLAHTDLSFRGMVGFPYSQQVSEALKAIKSNPDLSTIPIISPSVTSNLLSNSPNFYRIASTDQSQGTALAQFFCDSLIQSQPSDAMAMLRDNSDKFSTSLQLAFNNALNCGDPRDRTALSYTIGNPTSIQKAVDQALAQNVRSLFFSGYDQDMDTVEQEIHQKLQGQVSTVTIIGGDGLNNVDATSHYSYNRVYATDFTGPLSETNTLAKSFLQQGFPIPPFVNADPTSHLLWVPTDVLLSYDAANAFTKTVENVQNGNFAQDNFNTTLQTINFNGITGPVTFQGNSINGHISDRNQGYVYITCNDFAHNTHLIAQYSTINDGKSPAQKLSLSQADGVSTCS